MNRKNILQKHIFLIERKFSDMTEIMNTLTGLMADNLWAAPVLSLLAGIITSFTPCSLASVPMLLACVGAVGADRKKSVRLSLSMAAGMAVTLGFSAPWPLLSAIECMRRDTGGRFLWEYL